MPRPVTQRISERCRVVAFVMLGTAEADQTDRETGRSFGANEGTELGSISEIPAKVAHALLEKGILPCH